MARHLLLARLANRLAAPHKTGHIILKVIGGAAVLVAAQAIDFAAARTTSGILTLTLVNGGTAIFLILMLRRPMALPCTPRPPHLCGRPASRPYANRVRAVRCALLAIDIVSFASRSEDLQLRLRAHMYEFLASAFVAAHLPWEQSHREDRGDGILVAIPPGIPAGRILDSLTRYLRHMLSQHNQTANAAARIHLRMAVHHGTVYFDNHGITGRAVIHLFRLLNAAEFQQACASSRPSLSVIVSGELYERVIQRRRGITNPAAYHPIWIANKETTTLGWIDQNPQARR